MSRITLWGFYNYTDKTLFDSAPMPEGIDKQELVDLIMVECGDLFPYYQQPNYLRMQIDNFFRRKKPNFDKMIEVLSAQYDPLENYDRKEEWKDEGKENGSNKHDEGVRGSANDRTYGNSVGNNVSKISAMDSDTLVTDTGADTSNTTSSNATTTNDAHRTIDVKDEKEHEATHSGRVHGNIGVTTSMQLVKEELELRRYDIMENIVRMFEKDVIIQVY